MKITVKEIKALKIIAECKSTLGILPSEFGFIYFDNPQQRHLLEAISNQGNGACHGKKSWRAAGCILGKIRKKGYVYCIHGRYTLTALGKDVLRSSEVQTSME